MRKRVQRRDRRRRWTNPLYTWLIVIATAAAVLPIQTSADNEHTQEEPPAAVCPQEETVQNESAQTDTP